LYGSRAADGRDKKNGNRRTYLVREGKGVSVLPPKTSKRRERRCSPQLIKGRGRIAKARRE